MVSPDIFCRIQRALRYNIFRQEQKKLHVEQLHTPSIDIKAP